MSPALAGRFLKEINYLKDENYQISFKILDNLNNPISVKEIVAKIFLKKKVQSQVANLVNSTKCVGKEDTIPVLYILF